MGTVTDERCLRLVRVTRLQVWNSCTLLAGNLNIRRRGTCGCTVSHARRENKGGKSLQRMKNCVDCVVWSLRLNSYL